MAEALAVLLGTGALAFGMFALGHHHGVVETERRWSNAVQRADVARLEESERRVEEGCRRWRARGVPVSAPSGGERER